MCLQRGYSFAEVRVICGGCGRGRSAPDARGAAAAPLGFCFMGPVAWPYFFQIPFGVKKKRENKTQGVFTDNKMAIVSHHPAVSFQSELPGGCFF